MDAILTKTGVTIDGQRRLRIDARGVRTIRLAEIKPDAVGGELIYRGHLRSQGLSGRAFFEIRCSIPGRGEYSAQGFKEAVTGSTEWITQATRLTLENGDRCETAKLNVIVAGHGVVWVSNIALARVIR